MSGNVIATLAIATDHCGVTGDGILATIGVVTSILASVWITNRQILNERKRDQERQKQELQNLFDALTSEILLFKEFFLEGIFVDSPWLNKSPVPINDPTSVLPEVTDPRFPVFHSNSWRIGTLAQPLATAILRFYAGANSFLGWVAAYSANRTGKRHITDVEPQSQADAQAREFVRRILLEQKKILALTNEALAKIEKAKSQQ